MAGTALFFVVARLPTLVPEVQGAGSAEGGAAMAGPSYVAVLSARPHVVDACSWLRPYVQNTLTPVWNRLHGPNFRRRSLLRRPEAQQAAASAAARTAVR